MYQVIVGCMTTHNMCHLVQIWRVQQHPVKLRLKYYSTASEVGVWTSLLGVHMFNIAYISGTRTQRLTYIVLR